MDGVGINVGEAVAKGLPRRACPESSGLVMCDPTKFALEQMRRGLRAAARPQAPGSVRLRPFQAVALGQATAMLGRLEAEEIGGISLVKRADLEGLAKHPSGRKPKVGARTIVKDLDINSDDYHRPVEAEDQSPC